MNAFFRQTRALRQFVPGTRDIESAELVNEDFAGEGGDANEAEIYYELRNGLSKVAYPVFVDGTEIGRSGYVSEVSRRDELGKLIVQSEDSVPNLSVFAREPPSRSATWTSSARHNPDEGNFASGAARNSDDARSWRESLADDWHTARTTCHAERHRLHCGHYRPAHRLSRPGHPRPVRDVDVVGFTLNFNGV